jgi:hypothetical protein
MHVYVQNWATTTLPCRSVGVRGFVFNQSVAPVNAGIRPSTGTCGFEKVSFRCILYLAKIRWAVR